MTTKLAERALLVSLNISQWAGRKFDKRATETVTLAHNASQRAGNFTKKLLPGAVELARVGQLATAIRQFVYSETLPWHTDGSRILASSNYMDFTKKLGAFKERYTQAVDAFIAVYPELKEKARRELGDLFSEQEYPTAGNLRERFGCDAVYMPVPTLNDFRVTLLDSEREAFSNTMRQVEAKAAKECWNRLYDVVSKAVRVLEHPDGIFRDTLVTNIVETCGVLSKLNVTDDANLEAMRQSVEKLATKITPDNLRHDPRDRINAVVALSDAEAKMKAYMGVL